MRKGTSLAVLVVALAGMSSAQQAITYFPLSTPGAGPNAITPGPDGNLWFTQQLANRIGKISTTGVILGDFPIPTPGSSPTSIVTGPDGNLWFTEQNVGKIGRIAVDGTITEFTLATYPAGNPITPRPYAITSGPNGTLWFTDSSGYIGVFTPPTGTSLAVTQFPSLNNLIYGITSGPDGNIWFTDQGTNSIGKITPAGVITEYSIKTPASSPLMITTGSDGNLWFTGQAGLIGKITTAGKITEYPLPVAGSSPGAITAAPGGNLWFTEATTSKIGIISTGGVIVEFQVASDPVSITAGPDGRIWFTELFGNDIGTVATTQACTIPGVTISDTSWGSFTAPAGSVVWFNAHTSKPNGIPLNAPSTLSFTGGTLVVRGVSYPLPDGLMIFDPLAPATPSTTFNAGLNRWETTFNPNNLDEEMFFAGAAIPVNANLTQSGKAMASYSVASNAQPLSFNWQWSAAVYTYWPGDWNTAQIAADHSGLHAGAPQNPAVQQALINGPRGGGSGNNYTGSSSSTGGASCTGKK